MKNNYELREDCIAIFVTCNGEITETIISIDSFDKVNSYTGTWVGRYDKSTSGNRYVIGNFKREDGGYKQVRLHRFIMDAPPSLVVDHINHDTLDNRIENLTLATKTENALNRDGLDSRNTSGVRGVHWNSRTSLWRARLWANGKHIEIGSFKELDAAKEAIERERLKLFPYLNRLQERR